MAILFSLTTGTSAGLPQGRDSGLDFIDTSFENASPVWYERAPDGTIRVHLLYDHERSSPNRAAGHIHLRLHGRTGSRFTLEFMNQRFLEHYTVYILPMANKDGVARGMTRFNVMGKDLNRNWDTPADPNLAPENAALERWLEQMIADGRRPHLAMELHNDGNGRLHISRPPVPQLPRHLERMAVLESLLRKKTWFTEGSTNEAFRNSGTLGDGWLERYGIDAVVHEFNCNWIAGLETRPLGRHWSEYGEKLAEVFDEYFRAVKP